MPTDLYLNGFTLINDTAAHTDGPYICVQAVGAANAVINNSGTTVSGATDFDAAITLATGERLEGHFTSITLTSGAVVAYKARNASRV